MAALFVFFQIHDHQVLPKNPQVVIRPGDWVLPNPQTHQQPSTRSPRGPTSTQPTTSRSQTRWGEIRSQVLLLLYPTLQPTWFQRPRSRRQGPTTHQVLETRAGSYFIPNTANPLGPRDQIPTLTCCQQQFLSGPRDRVLSNPTTYHTKTNTNPPCSCVAVFLCMADGR